MEKEMFEFFRNSLLGSATGKPLCEDYKKEWKACGEDKDRLMKFALRQQCLPFIFTYSYRGEGLSKEYLLREFGEYINGQKTVYDADGVHGYTYALNVDLKEEIEAPYDVSAFMYCKDANVVIPSTKCPSLFIGCGSDVNLILDGYNSVRVHLYDDSKVTIDDADLNSEVTVYKYSDDCSVEMGKYCLCDVGEFRKDLKLQL